MTFTVQEKPLRGEDVLSVTEYSPKGAMKKALNLIGQGFSDVRTVTDGRSYTMMESAAVRVQDS